MSAPNIHERAAMLARQLGCTHADALAILGTRGATARKRRHVYGVLHVTRADRQAFARVEAPAGGFWWQRLD